MPTLATGAGDSQVCNLELPHADKTFALPRSERRLMEDLLDVDLSAVRIHLTGQPLTPGVMAAACGDDIHVVASAFRPETEAGLRLLAHELTHVAQQRGGPAATAARATWFVDADLEAEADRIAELAVSGSRALAPVVGAVRPRSRRTPVIQPYVMMARERWRERDEHFTSPAGWTIREADYQLLRDADAAWRMVAPLARFDGATAGEQDAMRDLLRAWMGIEILGQIYTRPGVIARGVGRNVAAIGRMVLGRGAELRYYNTYRELSQALLGDVRAQPASLYETALAKAVLRTAWVAGHLRRLCAKVVTYWDGLQSTLHGGGPPRTTLGYSRGEPWYFTGAYFYYHYFSTPLSGLKKADGQPIRVNVAVFHDMMEFVKDRAGPDHLHRTIQWDNPYTMAREDIDKRDMRNNLGTVNEKFDWVKMARQLRMPVHAGPSYTVSQMLALAEAAGGTPDEKTALAYAIFAFWNQVYATQCTPIHRYIEVMVAAANFEVTFNPMWSLKQNAPAPIAVMLDAIWLAPPLAPDPPEQ